MIYKPSKSSLPLGFEIAHAYVPLFIAACVAVYLKYSLMNEYWTSLARLMELPDAPIATALGYFSLDVLVSFILVPAVVVSIAVSVARPIAQTITTTLACILIVVYFVQARAHHDFGQYASATFLVEAMRFAASDGDTASRYAPTGAIVKLLFALVITACSTRILTLCRQSALWRKFATLTIGIMVAVVTALMVTAILFVPATISGLHRDAASLAITSLFSDFRIPSATPRSAQESVAAFRHFSMTPSEVNISRPVGSQRDSNVLYFIFETGPAELFPEFDASELLPPDLKNKSLVALSHHSTYPYTSDATFSILTGLYPAGRRELISRGGFRKHQALFSRLRQLGYSTGFYVPAIYNGEVDEVMMGQLGFDHVFVANRGQDVTPELQAAIKGTARTTERIIAESPHFAEEDRARLSLWMKDDLHALEHLKRDMRKSLREGRRFAYVFTPEVGHGPWFKIGKTNTTKAFGREMMRVQADWLRELVDIIRFEGALENTVILVTSDHGIRTRKEDPDYAVGTISSYSFHVPLMLYAPSAFSGPPLTQERLTSHIDIEPTVALLLGLQKDLGMSQGLPLWDSLPSPRKLFYFASKYGGADGYFHDAYFMRNVITETAYRSPLMNFRGPESVTLNDEMATHVQRELERFHKNHLELMSSL